MRYAAVVVLCLVLLRCDSPVSSVPATSWRAVAAGYGVTCGIANTRVAYCWGGNSDGQTGTGAATVGDTLLVPTAVLGGLLLEAITVGRNVACARTLGGVAYCWGRGDSGRVGNGGDTNVPRPVLVAGNRVFNRVAAGWFNVCGAASTGAGYCWGEDDRAGQMGNGPGTGSAVPSLVSGSLNFSQIDVGSLQVCGVASGGVAYCWGSGPLLGHGTDTSTTVPVAVAGGVTFQNISADFDHTCAIAVATLGEQGYCWGLGASGKLGNGADTATLQPVAIAGGLTLAQISAGASHTCAVTTTGAAFCWGANAGALGTGTVGASQNTPQAVSGGLTFASVSAGFAHSCGLTTAGELYCWGDNQLGALGDGTRVTRPAPVLIGVPP